MNNIVFGKLERLQEVKKLKESEYSTEMCRWILKPLGVWPSNSKLFFSLLTIMYYFLIIFSLIPMTLYAIFGENDINLRLKCIGPINFCLVGLCKYTILLLKKKEISDCIDHINYDWNQAVNNKKDRKVMITKAKLGRLIIIICTIFMASGIIFYQIIIPLTAPRIITPDNKTIRPFGYPVYQPLIPSKYQSINHLIIDVVQLMGGITAGTIAIGTFSISAVFALHSCGQYDIVNLRILNFVDEIQQAEKFAVKNYHNSFLLIPITLHAFIAEHDINLKLKCIGPINFCLLGLCKYTILLLKKKKISDCIDHMKYDWNQIVINNEDRKAMIIQAKLGSYPIYQPLLPSNSEIIHLIIDILQFMGGMTAGTVAIGTFSISSLFVLHSCGLYDIVNLRILDFIDIYQNKNNTMDKKTAEIVQLQIRILTFIRQIENILNEACFFEFLSSTTGICILMYNLMTEIQQADKIGIITYLFVLVHYVFNIFILSYVGEKLSQQAQDVGSTVYMINWHQLPPKIAKNFILILLMSKYPNTLTAGKIMPLCYSTFCGIIKTAVAYLNILRSVV
ncbi:uncharacterized protein LOC122851055 [Aphidius gifuensis]|uniref:uncharacterized protein LOC122851055 n=1 Tax=Aphidius gifuensis TaxID=684658 RepID=UPI001CDC8A56|nr:uncharacterized protein LOC122851055 [Aphidius gifuensis]